MLVNSPGFIEHIKARGGKDIVLVPNGADTRMFDPQADGAAFRHENELADKFVALYAGAHGMSNDLTLLLEAADQLRERTDIALVFLGDGKEKLALMARADSLNLKNVCFIPPVPKTEIGVALAASDACIAILKPIAMYKTVYPNKVFDYMAAGRPVILAIDGVIRQVVDEANAGISVAPGNADDLVAAICTLANNRQRGRQMGQNGRAYIEEHFDRRLLSRKMANVFEAMIQE